MSEGDAGASEKKATGLAKRAAAYGTVEIKMVEVDLAIEIDGLRATAEDAAHEHKTGGGDRWRGVLGFIVSQNKALHMMSLNYPALNRFNDNPNYVRIPLTLYLNCFTFVFPRVAQHYPRTAAKYLAEDIIDGHWISPDPHLA